MIGLPQGDSPLLLNSSCTVTANVELPAGGAGTLAFNDTSAASAAPAPER